MSEALVPQVTSQETHESSDVKELFRRRLPDERKALTHHFSLGGQEGYLTVGLYEDGVPGEIFITMSKEGSTVSGLMDCFATAVSLALQYGVPLKVLCQKFSHTRFEPSGFSGNPEIGYAKSLMGHESTSMDDRYTMIDDEALEEARRKMEAFQNSRGLIGTANPAKRIKELRAEIHRLTQALQQKSASHVPLSPRRSRDIP